MTLLNYGCCGKPHKPRFIADAGKARRHDPTGTGKIRNDFRRALVGRFRRIKKLIVEAVGKLDVLGLDKTTITSTSFAATFKPKDAAIVLGDASAPPKGAFAFETSSDKVHSFMSWLQSAQNDEILQIQHGTSKRVSAQTAWQNVYIDSAYKKGMRDAAAKIGKGALVGGFNQPIHADAVGLIYTRTYSDLEGITDAMDTKISRVLANGIAQGRGAMDIASELAEAVDSIGIVRAEVIARTELIAAYSEATLNSYEEAKIEGVTIEAEFSTSKDDAVCPDCEELEGEVYSIDDARGIIPVHPNCRCAFIPVVGAPE